MPPAIVSASDASPEQEAEALSVLVGCLADLAPADLRDDGTYAALTTEGCTVLGAAVLRWSEDAVTVYEEMGLPGSPYPMPACILESLAVRKEHRGRGVGAALVEHVLRVAAGRGFRTAYAAALLRPHQGSRGLFLRSGFRTSSLAVPLREGVPEECRLCRADPCDCEAEILVASLIP